VSLSFPTYREAHTYAVKLARMLGRETGIEATRHYGKPVFCVHTLPKPEHRQGFELRVEVVHPSDPIGGPP